MEYNSTRVDLIMPEYGRAIHKMVDHIKKIEDRAERNKAALALIDIMGVKNPHLRDVEDFTHKLWDHLFIMAEYNLDVDSPYPIPLKSTDKGPDKIEYFDDSRLKFKFYGRTVRDIIQKATLMEEGEEKEALIEIIANLMKKFYLNYNKESVEDEVINQHLQNLSNGALHIKESYNIDSTIDILSHKNKRRKRPTNKNYRKKKNNQKRS